MARGRLSEQITGKPYYRELVRAPGAESLTIAEHRRIFEAIAARDPEAAEAAMRDHIARANEL